MNLHGSTVTNLFGVGFGGVFFAAHSGSTLIAGLFLGVTVLSFVLAVAFLVRFFMNYRKYKDVIEAPVCIITQDR
jgi:hypothetical protein